MDLENLKNKLRKYSKKDIIFTTHSEIQAMVRDIDLNEVKSNIIDPKRLIFFQKQETKNKDKEKYDCYFSYNKHLCHRYILTTNSKVIIVTIIKINRDWQKIIEGKNNERIQI